MRTWIAKAGTAFIAFSLPTITKAEVSLFEYESNIDGVISPLGGLPPAVNLSAFDTTTGLGTVVFSLSGPGTHYVGSFFDHDIDEAVNTFFNEVGSTSLGSPAAGQSWEIDEPGFTFGDIFTNFKKSALDNTVGTTQPDDVSMAMAYNFVLDPSQTATISFRVSQTAPASGFYLQQLDPDSDQSVFLSASLVITGSSPNGVPDSSQSGELLLIALAPMWFCARGKLRS